MAIFIFKKCCYFYNMIKNIIKNFTLAILCIAIWYFFIPSQVIPALVLPILTLVVIVIFNAKWINEQFF